MKQWSEDMSREHADSAYLALGELGMPEDRVTDVIDTSDFLGMRWEAIRTHRSKTSPFEGLPQDRARAFPCREHLALVPSSNPATHVRTG